MGWNRMKTLGDWMIDRLRVVSSDFILINSISVMIAAYL